MGNDEMPKIIAYLFLFALGGLFFGVGFMFIYFDYVAATEWEPVNGTVTSSQLLEEYDYEDSGMLYQADIDYNYEYKERRHSGHCCDYSTSDEWGMQKMVDTHSPGSTVEILVNPDNPFESRLKADVKPFDLFKLAFAGVGGLLLLIGIFAVFMDLKKRFFG